MTITITNNEFRQLLDKELSPIMLQYGFKYDGQYTWFGEVKNHMRKAISVYLLKGTASIFKWQITFDFIPLPTGNNLAYSRTEKSIKPHLYEYPYDYYKSFHGVESNVWRHSPCKMFLSGSNTQEIVNNIHQAFSCDFNRLQNWHNEFNELRDALRMVSDKIKPDGIPIYRFLSPSPVYVKSFILAALGEKPEGRELLTRYLSDRTWEDALKQKIIKAFDKVDVSLYQQSS